MTLAFEPITKKIENFTIPLRENLISILNSYIDRKNIENLYAFAYISHTGQDLFVQILGNCRLYVQ